MITLRDRRKKYLLDRKLQLRFVLLLVVQASIPIIITGGALYLVNKMYILNLQETVGELIFSSADVQYILHFSILTVLTQLVITALLLTFIGIRFSHHIAGPLHKLGISMEQLADGEKVEPISFRKTDILNGFADKFNAIIKRVDKTRE